MLFLPVGASALDRTQQGRERQDKPSDKVIKSDIYLSFNSQKQEREKEISERARESERISEYRVKDYIYTWYYMLLYNFLFLV